MSALMCPVCKKTTPPLAVICEIIISDCLPLVSLFLNVMIYVTEEEDNEGRPISDALGFDK